MILFVIKSFTYYQMHILRTVRSLRVLYACNYAATQWLHNTIIFISSTTLLFKTYPIIIYTISLTILRKDNRIFYADAFSRFSWRQRISFSRFLRSLWIHFIQCRLPALVNDWTAYYSSGDRLIELHPEWKSEYRVVLLCYYLRKPIQYEQSSTLLNQWIEEHISNTCVFSYDGLTKLQNKMLQLCSDYYCKENYSLCAIV